MPDRKMDPIKHKPGKARNGTGKRGRPPNYISEGYCTKCRKHIRLTVGQVFRMTLPKKNDRSYPLCTDCRRDEGKRLKARHEKTLRPKDMASARLRKITSDTWLFPSPDNGKPKYCPHHKRWFVEYRTTPKGEQTRNVISPVRERAYLDATDQESAMAEATDWITRALMFGARWLREDPEGRLQLEHEEELKKEGVEILNGMVPHTSKYTPAIVRYYVMVPRYKVVQHGRSVLADNLKTIEEGTQFIQRLKTDRKKAKFMPCRLCGQKPIEETKGRFVHDEPGCRNFIILQDKRMPKPAKVYLWNRYLRDGSHAGWGDFRVQHVVHMRRIAKIFRKYREDELDPPLLVTETEPTEPSPLDDFSV